MTFWSLNVLVDAVGGDGVKRLLLLLLYNKCLS